MKKTSGLTRYEDRHAVLMERRNLKMAYSPHAFVRGNTEKFYAWLKGANGLSLPKGPPVWICGDCHVGNLGPIGNSRGKIHIQIRDLDQTVIGNPTHDLIRLGVSLASAARSSDLPGVTTAKILEQMTEGYEQAFVEVEEDPFEEKEIPDSVKSAMKDALRRKWKHLANERIEDTEPTIPLGKRFWPLTKEQPDRAGPPFASKLNWWDENSGSPDVRPRRNAADDGRWKKGASRRLNAVLAASFDG